MTLDSYLNQLGSCLARLSPAERAEALRYYQEYAAEAGITDYAGMEAHFGSPRTLAAGIYAEAAARHTAPEDGQPRSISHGFLIALAALATLPLSLPVLFALGMIVFSLVISLGAVFVSLLATAIALAGAGLFTFLQAMLYLVPFRAGPLLLSLGGGLVMMALGGTGLFVLFWVGRSLMTHGTLFLSRFIKRRTAV